MRCTDADAWTIRNSTFNRVARSLIARSAPGPRLVARAATVDSERNLASLDSLAATAARIVLTGHGKPCAARRCLALESPPWSSASIPRHGG